MDANTTLNMNAGAGVGSAGTASDTEALSRINRVEQDIISQWQSRVSDLTARVLAVQQARNNEISAIRNSANAARSGLRKGFFWDNRGYNNEPRVNYLYGLRSGAFSNGWWAVGLGTLILGSIFFGFSSGFWLALLAIGGFPYVIMRMMNAQLERIEQSAAVEARDIEAVQRKYVPRMDPLTEEWSALCLDFSRRADQVASAMFDVLDNSHGRLFPLSEVTEQDMVRSGEAAVMSFCFGYRSPASFAARCTEITTMLQASSAVPEFRYGIPELYDLSQRRSLMIARDPNGPNIDLSDRLINTLILRVLLQIPPGKAVFSFYDPVGLGASFSPFLSLGDHSESVMGNSVLTNERQLRRKLEDTIEHIQNVTQKYLKADYADIESYNREAGEIAEPYRFLIIRGFPQGFTSDLARSLELILQNGPRCGVYVIAETSDTGGFGDRNALRLSADNCKVVFMPRSGHVLHSMQRSQIDPQADEMDPDELPDAAVIRKIVDAFGRQAADAMKVEVPYEALLPRAGYDAGWWQDSSADAISVPLGPVGAKDVLRLTLDSRLSHNALIVGRPGSGKSNLLHVFISMVARRYSPDEAELYLIDFKKGVEFKDYANSGLPHARVIAVESEREFGISVLKAIDAEMTRRSEAFKKADGVENIGEFRRSRPDARMPRAVLIIDEFQEFFSREDKIKEEALVLFDRIIRQGRSFGVHTLLGTQSLSNSGLPRSIIDQVPVRIALQCSEADSRQILADDNTVARSLSRPGEAIYNDKAGLIEGNRQFQVALFPNTERKGQLSLLEAHVASGRWSGQRPRIFEGQEPASLGACTQISRFNPVKPGSPVRVWIGEPVSLDLPVSYKLPPQPGRNLIVVGADEKRSADVILASLASLAVQLPPRDLEVRIIDLTTADAEWADYPESFRDAFPHRTEVGGRHDLRRVLTSLSETIAARRAEQEQASDNRSFAGQRIVFALVGLHRVREMRSRSEPVSIFAAADPGKTAEKDLNELLRQISADGPEVGVHTMLWVDSLASFEKVLGRSGIDEFAIRVCGPLAERESHVLLDNPLASRIDKPNRMILFDDELIGVYTPFRPYAIPSETFFEEFVRQAFQPQSEGVKDE